MATREQAIKWFNEKDTYNKSELSHKYYKDSVSYNFMALTGKEIENIWKCELLNEAFEKDNVKVRVVPTKENFYINKLKHFYKKFKFAEVEKWEKDLQRREYFSLREFCLDCSLLSFAEIEEMEEDINNALK